MKVSDKIALLKSGVKFSEIKELEEEEKKEVEEVNEEPEDENEEPKEEEKKEDPPGGDPKNLADSIANLQKQVEEMTKTMQINNQLVDSKKTEDEKTAEDILFDVFENLEKESK